MVSGTANEIDEVELHDARLGGIHVLANDIVVLRFSRCVAFSPSVNVDQSDVWECRGRLTVRGVRRLEVRDWRLAKDDYIYSSRIVAGDGAELSLSGALGTWLACAQLIVLGYGGQLTIDADAVSLRLSSCRRTGEIL